MSRIKEALTRKFGPLPAWAWLTIVGLAVWYYRRNQSNSVSGTGTGSVAPAPTTPQDVTTLQPGESAYDPNSGALVTAPGGDGTGGGSGNGNGTTTPDPLTGQLLPFYFPPGTILPEPNPTPIQKTVKPKQGSKHVGKGITKAIKPGQKTKSRSTATIKNVGRAIKKVNPKPKSTGVHVTGPAKKGTLKIAHVGPHSASRSSRQRPTTPATRVTVRQRPVASATPQHRTAPVPAPRPSSPPPRNPNRQRPAPVNRSTRGRAR